MRTTVLLVVLGAGASYDSVNPNDFGSQSDAAYRPPLAKELFDPRPAFGVAVSHYPACRPLVAYLRDQVRGGRDCRADSSEHSDAGGESLIDAHSPLLPASGERPRGSAGRPASWVGAAPRTRRRRLAPVRPSKRAGARGRAPRIRRTSKPSRGPRTLVRPASSRGRPGPGLRPRAGRPGSYRSARCGAAARAICRGAGPVRSASWWGMICFYANFVASTCSHSPKGLFQRAPQGAPIIDGSFRDWDRTRRR